MKVIIPMSGIGKRFKEKGYQDPKPLITVSGKPIIEHVISMFPQDSDFIFICNKNHLATTSMEEVLRHAVPQGRIIAIDEHKEGPVHATTFAFPYLKSDDEVVISYCDYFMVFDYEGMLQVVREKNFAGAVPSYTGFHPHLLHAGVYGGVLRDGEGVMLDYKEKYSFTSNLMDSYHSAGMYYFKKASELKAYTEELLASDLRVNGEKYTSMLFYLYLRDHKKIYVPEVATFMQWGTPEDLEEYVAFEEEILIEKGLPKKENGIPGERLSQVFSLKEFEGYSQAKNYWERFFK